MMGLDMSETCIGWRNILRISCASSWFFFTRLYWDARSTEQKKKIKQMLTYEKLEGAEHGWCLSKVDGELSAEDLTATDLVINPLNPELNPICYLLTLLAHHFLHVSRILVKSLTLRLLMSYIYIYIYIWSAYSWCF